MSMLILLSPQSASSGAQRIRVSLLEDQRGKVCSENGASWTGRGVQTPASLLDAGRAGAGSAPPPSACAVDDALQLWELVGEGEPDRRRGPGCQTGSAGPAETTTTARKL